MAESPLGSLVGLLNKLQDVFSSSTRSSAPLIEPKPTQLNEMVYEVFKPSGGEKPDLEIVFFHGIQTEHKKEACFTTWISSESSEFWLPWLEEVFPKARVLVISYDSSVQKTNDAGRQDMYITAENLVYDLTSDGVRVGEAGCPIVLVGHCLGGLVLKELCLTARGMLSRNSIKLPRVKPIHDFFSKLRGMFFYGTPHTGCLLGDKLHESFQGPRLSPLLGEMETLRASSARRNEEFQQLKSLYGWSTCGMGELHETFVECLGKYIHVVPEASTRPYMDHYYSASADHYTICKPDGKNAMTFQYLRNFLQEIHQEGVLRAKVVADAVGSQEHVVDLLGRAKEVERMMGQPDANTIFIVGMSGVGKTTIAKQVFRDVSHTFAIACYIELDTFEPHLNSSEQILKKIQDALHRVDEGWNFDQHSVLHYLQGKKVLMVVDNVESKKQLDALREAIWLEGSTSRLIVTTTDSRLGRSKSKTYEVPYLNDEESRQLFLHYAFDGEDEPQDLTQHVQQVIEKCECYPLALKVIGSFVSNEDVHEQRLWLGLIEKLEKAEEVDGSPDYRLFARLRPCYDALPQTEQEIFLDIAMVFHDLPVHFLECIWMGSWGNAAYIAYINLRRRFLVEERYGSIRMHGQLRDMGRSVASPPRITVDKWRRISSLESAKELIAKFQGRAQTRSLKMTVLKNERLILRNRTFLNCYQLLYLILDGIEMADGSVELPRSLVYLRWRGALFETCPVNFSVLENLTVLDLQDCRAMRSLPWSLVTSKRLLWLELEGCLSLRELPFEVSELNQLYYLGLSRTGLVKLPRNFGKLTKLRHFNAQQTQLTQIPKSIGRLNMLLTLDISNTPVKVLPESIVDLKFLRALNVSRTLVSLLPESIGQLQDLRSLNASGTLVKCLPESLGNVGGLEELRLAYTPLEELPEAICKLRSLSTLDVSVCEGLSRLPDSFGELAKLQKLFLIGSGVRRLPETLPKLSQLHSFTGSISAFMMNIQHLGSETPVITSDNQNRSDSLDSLGFELATDLIVGDENDAALLYLQRQFLGLRTLNLSGDSANQSEVSALFRVLRQMHNLSELSLENYPEVETMPCELGTLIGLKTLRIRRWERLRELPESMGQLVKLWHVELVDLPRLCKLPESLRTLPDIFMEITGCESLRSMPSSSGHVSSVGEQSSTSPDDGCTATDTSPPSYHISRSWHVYTDSWSILRCLLECCGERNHRILFKVKCGEFERFREMVGEEERGKCITTKAMKEVGLEVYGGDDGVHEVFTPSTSWVRLDDWRYSPNTQVSVQCDQYLCNVHYLETIPVMDAPKDTDIETDEED